jgi:3-phosphoshikimate 1-carboxyvinyltransferase
VASAQVKSAILLAGLYADGQTTVRQPGPARDHTERLLLARGVDLKMQGNAITLIPNSQPLSACSFSIPADFSSAAFPLAAALLISSADLTLEGVGVNPTRTGLLEVLERMGAEFQWLNSREQGGEPVADLRFSSQTTRGPSGMERGAGLRGVEVGGDLVVRMIDEFPILAVVATQAKGDTLVRDARELRVKESDRIAAVAAELRKMGAAIEEREDGFVVKGPTLLRGASVDSRGDHRLAMALAVAGMMAEGETMVEGAEIIGDSFPGFVDLMKEIGGRFEEL